MFGINKASIPFKPKYQPENSPKLRKLCIVYEHRTKNVQGRGHSYINLGLFVCFFDVYRIP